MRHSRILGITFGLILLLFLTNCATEKPLTQTSEPITPAPAAKVSVIQKISFNEEENYTRIRIEGSETIGPPFYKLLTEPLRIAVDVPNIDLKEIKSPLRIENGTIGEVVTTQFDDRGRIEISLAQMTNYNISKDEKNLIIDIEKVRRAAEVVEAKKEEETVKETKAEAPAEEPKKEEALPSPPPPNKAKEVVNVSFEQKDDCIIFNITADGKVENFNAFKLDSPARLVMDIWGVDTRKTSFKVKSPLVKGVRIGHYQDKLRLVFDSQKPQLPPYQVNRIDDQLIVSLGNIPQPSEPQIYVQAKPGKEAPAAASKAVTENPQKPGKPGTLTGINFKQMDNKSRITLSFSAEDPQFESSMASENVISVDVKNAFASKQLLRRLDTQAFESAVNYIDLKNVKTGKVNDIRVSVKLREQTSYETSKEGKEIFIDIKEKPKKIEAKVESPRPEVKKEEAVAEVKKEELKKDEIKKEEVKKEEKLATESKKENIAEEKSALGAPVAKKGEERKKVAEEGFEKAYAGRKLSLDFKDADIKNILRLIAEVSNLNVIAADDVTGKITMRLVDVPWDQALEIILQSRSLGMTRVGNVVRIAPLDTLKKEIQSELEAKRSKERLEDLVMELVPVNYAAAKEILPQVKSVLSDRGDVKVDERTNTLIVKDIARSIPGVKGLVKSLDTKTPQVVIEARIVEANLQFQRELGVSWGFLAQKGKATSATQTSVGGGLLGVSSVVPTTILNNVIGLPAVPQGGVSGVGTAGVLEMLFTSKYGMRQLDIQISAHENEGNVKIISSPKIATLDNKEASIEQGLRIPYRKLTTEGTVTTDFIDANLKLTVTPHVTNEGFIKMVIKAKKDAPDWSHTVDNVPSIDKKEAISEVLVRDNGVIVIAGVYSIEKDDLGEGVPLFNKIPLLGWLFKREAKQDLRRDLLIFISPKILKDEV
ncbi:MAG: type IV pilus secretin PilQ [Thermodesulfobacteriota bacterium]